NSCANSRFWLHARKRPCGRLFVKAEQLESTKPVIDRATNTESAKGIQCGECHHQPDQGPAKHCPAEEQCKRAGGHEHETKKLSKAMGFGIIIQHIRFHP